MAGKPMVMPSARTRYIKEDNMKLILYSLIVVAAFMVVTNMYLFSIMHGVKQILMIYLSILVTREVEILYYSFYFDIERGYAKELIEKSYFRHTALIYALLIPIGTPLWLVVVGAVMATFLGKLMFGGYHHMVFHSSLVGFLFVTLGWNGLAVNASFVNSFSNNVLEFVFANDALKDIFATGLLIPETAVSSLSVMTTSGYPLTDLLFGFAPGIVGNGILLLAIFAFLLYRKAINYITPVTIIVSYLITALIVGLVSGYDPLYAINGLFSGYFLFVVIFLSTNPITTPIPDKGKIIYGVIVGVLTVFIRNAGTYEEGIIFAVLFMSMLTPMINTELKKKPIPKKDLMPKQPKKAGE